MQKKIKKGNLYTAILLMTLLVIYQYGIHKIYGMSEYPDEFGYWSSAAGMLGWDWSQIASRGSYYSFGYSLILLPFLKFCEDSVTAYRMAVTTNFVFLMLSFFLLKGIYTRIFTEQVEGEEILPIGLAMLYPAWCFYAQTTMVDSLLIFMVILICYLWVRFTEVPNIRWGILLAAAVIYNYSLHMRSAGILAAVIIALLLWAWKNTSHRKKVFFLLLTVIISLLFLMGIKETIQESVYAYAGTERLNTNDYGGQWKKVGFLFSLEGIKQAFIVSMGKVLYLGIAGGGFVYMAVDWCIKPVTEWWKNILEKQGQKKKDTELCQKPQETIVEKKDRTEWFRLFLLLIIAGQMAVCVIYTIYSTNADWLIYGRYIEAIVPIAIFVGASYALQEKIKKRTYLLWGSLFTLAAFSCICKVYGSTKSYIRGEHSVATIFLLGDGNVEPVCFFVKVWLAGMLVMAAGTFLIKGFQKQKTSQGVFMGICIVLALWTVFSGKIYIYRANEKMAEERILVNVLEEQAEEGKEIYYLEEEKQDWICYVQMQLQERTLNVIEIEELEKRNPLKIAVVADKDSEYLRYLEENYNRKIAGQFHYVFYRKQSEEKG